jgi:hypothetical protein
MSHGEEFGEASEQSRRSLPKTLFTLSQCRIAENDGFGDLLTRSQMHVDERGEEVLAMQQRMR